MRGVENVRLNLVADSRTSEPLLKRLEFGRLQQFGHVLEDEHFRLYDIENASVMLP